MKIKISSASNEFCKIIAKHFGETVSNLYHEAELLDIPKKEAQDIIKTFFQVSAKLANKKTTPPEIV